MTAAVAPLPIGSGETNARRNTEVGMAVAVLFIVALLMVPLPGVLLDLFLATSIGASIVVLLVALNTSDPLEFSGFPSLLLLLTLFRLALNVCTTRLILGEGHAGSVVQSFGEFVIGGNYALGLVLFLILIAINFIVITQGAGRVAEVAARFTLDAMPGKQMAIDADLSARLIDERQARGRRDADGDRRRPAGGPHRREAGPQAPRGDLARRGLLRRDGRLVQVREGRRHRRLAHHGDQHRRRDLHRRVPEGTADRPGALA